MNLELIRIFANGWGEIIPWLSPKPLTLRTYDFEGPQKLPLNLQTR